MFILPHIIERIRKIRYVNHFEKSTFNPMKAQEALLLDIIGRNKDTLFGKKHSFSKISSIGHFQKNVPIRKYSHLKKYVDRHIEGKKAALVAENPIIFATTSGSTGKPKFIPVTQSYIDKYREGWHIWLYYVYKDHPKIFEGKILAITSPKEEGLFKTKVPYGSISGLINEMQPSLVKKHYAIPSCVFKIKDYEAKYYTIVRLALQQNISFIATPNPGTILMLCKKINEHSSLLIEDIQNGTLSEKFDIDDGIRFEIEKSLKPDPKRSRELQKHLKRHNALYPKHFWPDLALIGCWKGGSLMLYLDEFPKHFGKTPIRDIGLMATEGRCSIPITNKGSSGILAITNNFFEFICENDIEKQVPEVLTCDRLKEGKQYAVILTNHAGLYRYHLNDIVKVVGFHNNTPLIEFIRKGERISSMTGEKLTEWQVVHAVKRASSNLSIPISNFTAVAEFGNPPHYNFLAEISANVSKEKKSRLIKRIDRSLALMNIEYMVKRASKRLGPPVLKVVRAGSYDSLASHGYFTKRDAQLKMPYLTADSSIESQLTVIERITPVGVASIMLLGIFLGAKTGNVLFWNGITAAITGAVAASGPDPLSISSIAKVIITIILIIAVVVIRKRAGK